MKGDNLGGYPMPTRGRVDGMVYEKPPAVPSDQAEYHGAAQWRVCAVCHESWLCREHAAHGHPGCPGKPWPEDWPKEGQRCDHGGGPA